MRYSNQQSTHAEPTTSPYKSSSSMAESLHQAAAAHGFDLTPYIGSSTFYDSSDASDSSIERLQSSSKTSPSLIPNWKSFSNGYFNAQTLPDGILDKKSGTSSYASFDSSLPTQVAPATYLPAEPQNAFRAKLYQGILSKKKISDSRRSNGPSITPFTCLDGFLETRQKPNGNGLLQNNIPRSPSFDKSESNSAVNMPNSFSSSSSSVLPLQQDMFFRSVNEIAGMGMHSVSSICRSVFSDENLQGNNRKRLLNFSNSKKEVDSSIKVPRMWDSYQGLASSTSGSMSSDEKIVKWYKITVQKVADTYFLKSEEALNQQQRMITQMNDTDPIEINESSDSLMQPLKNDLEMKLHNPQPISTDICSKAHSIFDDEPLDLTMSASASCEIESVIKSPDIDTYDNPEPFEVDSESLKEPIVDLVDNEVIGYSDDTKVPRSRRECRKGPGIARNLKSAKLWELLLWLLSRPDQYSAVIQWRNKSIGYFKLVSDELLLEIYNDYKDSIPGRVPLKRKILYSSITRALRHYYWNSTLHPTPKRKTYQFGPNATDWQLGVQREHALQSLDYWERTKHQRNSYSHTLYAEPSSPDSSDGETPSQKSSQITSSNTSTHANKPFSVFENGRNGVFYGNALDKTLRIEENKTIWKSSISSEGSNSPPQISIKEESHSDQNYNTMEVFPMKPIRPSVIQEKDTIFGSGFKDDEEDDKGFLPIDLTLKLNVPQGDAFNGPRSQYVEG